MNLPLETWLPRILELSEDAGRRILDVYHGNYHVSCKDNNTPVTDADFAAHHAILAGLAILTPDLPALSEESEDIPYSERRQWRDYWLIDPLDGTREFIKGNGEFTVNIALIHRHEAVLGVIHCPVSGVNYYACRGQGAFKQIPGQTPQRIQVQSSASSSIRVAGSRSYPSRAWQAFVANLEDHEIINMGSSLKSCLVAEGKIDIYPRFGPTGEWDTAAAQCIVEEAGGHFTDTCLQPLRYNTRPSLLNPHFIVFGDSHYDWRAYLPEATDYNAI